MWTVYKSGTRIVKGRFEYEDSAREFHKCYGGDLVRNCSANEICQYCLPCQCGHNADEHLAGEGNCFKCNCPQFTEEMTLTEDGWKP